MISKRPGSSPDLIQVEFHIFMGVWATQVSLVGDFNNWDPQAHPLEHSLHNGWRITLELRRGHAYHYRYLLDRREWLNDSDADDYAPNPYGGLNSVVRT
jgi:1,4-alpha-glucan branching enzyme